MKKTFFIIMALIASATANAQQTIDHTMCVAAYDYTCHTTDKDGKAADVKYRIALQVGQKVSCSMGYAQHCDSLKGEKREEAKRQVPRVYQGYPAKKITAHEVMPFDRFTTTEAMGIKWKLTNETDTVMNLACQKAVGDCHGRTWTVWFTPDIPSSAGPWRLHGLPGLILKAEADGMHRFECFQIDFVKEAIVLQPYDGIQAPHSKFVKHRNKKLDAAFVPSGSRGHSLYDFDTLIPVSQIDNVMVMHGSIYVNGITMIDTDTKFQPLELK